jgi:hypothetical protein
MISAAGKGEGKSRDGRTAFAVFLTDNLEFTRTVPLNPVLNPGEPCVKIFEEGPGSCPVQHDYDCGVGKSGLRAQEV